jgi:hypothetical protein
MAMPCSRKIFLLVLLAIALLAGESRGQISREVAPGIRVPDPGHVLTDAARGEVILSAQVQHPAGKPCIDAYGQRIQAFAGCAKAAGGDAKMAAYFVFLVDVSTEQVFEALMQIGARSLVHYSIQEGLKRSGLGPNTRPEDYLQGDPVILSVLWLDPQGNLVEQPYEFFVTESVTVEGKEIEKPWTPHFVFHGSGALHSSGTGCIACPCDCPGGIIADNRFPVYDPKPMVKFHLDRAPPAGTQAYVRIRAISSRNVQAEP